MNPLYHCLNYVTSRTVKSDDLREKPAPMSDDIRVLIAEDSPTVRVYLKALIEETPGMRVIGLAHDGEQVVSLVQELKPDVVSMDIRMPRLDGLEATRRIMNVFPTPVVVVSGLLDVDIELSLQALEAGALAVVSKPPDRAHKEFATKRQQLVTTLRAMAGVRVIARRDRLWQAQPTPQRDWRVTPVVERVPVRPFGRRTRPEIVAIGASTGGPSAVHRLLQELPDDFPLPILIVQHMPNEFIGGLARWLDSATDLEVAIASDGMILEQGVVYLAPGTAHLSVQRKGMVLVARLQKEPQGYRYQPSVDVLFESIARACGSAAIGIVLTGMGDDGAAGLLAMREQGAYTVAQDEASSTVFGMPAAAIGRGAAEIVEPLANIAPEIVKLI
jgi:two-component system, chemotaxis family, protein-glutamate methylesterase/glutaminase